MKTEYSTVTEWIQTAVPNNHINCLFYAFSMILHKNNTDTLTGVWLHAKNTIHSRLTPADT